MGWFGHHKWLKEKGKNFDGVVTPLAKWGWPSHLEGTFSPFKNRVEVKSLVEDLPVPI